GRRAARPPPPRRRASPPPPPRRRGGGRPGPPGPPPPRPPPDRSRRPWRRPRPWFVPTAPSFRCRRSATTRLLDLLDLDHGLALVVATARAHAVRQLGLVAVRAEAEPRGLQVVVGAAAVAAGRGMGGARVGGRGVPGG